MLLAVEAERKRTSKARQWNKNKNKEEKKNYQRKNVSFRFCFILLFADSFSVSLFLVHFMTEEAFISNFCVVGCCVGPCQIDCLLWKTTRALGECQFEGRRHTNTVNEECCRFPHGMSSLWIEPARIYIFCMPTERPITSNIFKHNFDLIIICSRHFSNRLQVGINHKKNTVRTVDTVKGLPIKTKREHGKWAWNVCTIIFYDVCWCRWQCALQRFTFFLLFISLFSVCSAWNAYCARSWGKGAACTSSSFLTTIHYLTVCCAAFICQRSDAAIQCLYFETTDDGRRWTCE